MAEFKVYKDAAGGWRWRLRANNNKITADSGESYVSRSNAVDGAKRVRSEVAGARIVDDQTGEALG